jgi:CRISPR-associated protein Cas1
MSPDDTLYGRIKNGVLTLSGNNPSIRVTNGYLIVTDGPEAVPTDHRGPAPPVEDRMATVRLPRAGCPVNRIVVTRPDGFITFAAIKWLHDVGASLIQLDWDGTVLLATAAAGPDQPVLRRAQALASSSETGLSIMREILRIKLRGQAEVSRMLGSDETAILIGQFAGALDDARTAIQILAAEAAAAAAYWALWRPLRLLFARRYDVPEHWRTFGSRQSPLTGKPLDAASPGNAILNYLYGILAGEMTIALIAAGLDSGIGIFHTDRDRRPSLAYDVMEVARPYVDAWLAQWLADARFSKRDFHEETDGAIRLTRPLTSHLAMSAPIWRTPASMVAHWLPQALSAGEGPGGARQSLGATNDHRRLAPPLPAFPAPRRAWRGLQLPILKTCHECGKGLASHQRKFCSPDCAMSFHLASNHASMSAAGFTVIAAAGGTGGDRRNEGEAITSMAERNRRHLAERRAWDAQHSPGEGLWNARRKADPTQDRLRRWYVAELAPRVATLRTSVLVQATGLSIRYAIMIRQGYVPHPRHFPALAKLAGVPAPKSTWLPTQTTASLKTGRAE